MPWGEFFGYVASILVFATFYMRTMVPLRLVAIASNVAFITYAAIDGLTPILILHCALLPLNVVRLLQLRDFVRQVEQAAKEGFSAQALLPLMRRRTIRANETLFAANEYADELYYVVDGTLFLPDLNEEIGPGSFVGEFALFSESGRRTATVVARTDCTLMILGRNAVFSALLQHPRLGIHLLKLITARMLHNAGRSETLPTPPAEVEKVTAASRRPAGSWLWRRRSLLRVAGAVLFAVALYVAVTYQPVFKVLYRDAVVTTWANVVTAPIAGTLEGLAVRPGDRFDGPLTVARIVNRSADRGDVIRAESALTAAEARLAQVTAYDAHVSDLAREWQDRRARYAKGFSRDLDLKVRDLEHRVALLQERTSLSEASMRRKRALRASGNVSQAEEDAAISSHRELQGNLTDVVEELERARHRRDLAGRGIYLQEDGKEPEWSWRSIDEIRLEAAKTRRALRDAEEDLKTAQSSLTEARSNLLAHSDMVITMAAGMTVWATSATDGAFVTRGERLFTWIDCSRLLVDVPVTETTATLVDVGAPAEVTLDGEADTRKGVVIISRASSSRLAGAELISVRGWRHAAAQIVVELKDPASIAGCPIGRRAFVRFPDLRLIQFFRAYMPVL